MWSEKKVSELAAGGVEGRKQDKCRQEAACEGLYVTGRKLTL